MKTSKSTVTKLAVFALLMTGLAPARAVDFHVTTAQELQNALTLAAAHGESHS